MSGFFDCTACEWNGSAEDAAVSEFDPDGKLVCPDCGEDIAHAEQTVKDDDVIAACEDCGKVPESDELDGLMVSTSDDGLYWFCPDCNAANEVA
jgi:predicted RNA-binding Zn-ribbon protein involved in translation (DUF1610 family)